MSSIAQFIPEIGDGNIDKSSTTWSGARDAATGDNVDYSGDSTEIQCRDSGAVDPTPHFIVIREFLAFNLARLKGAREILSATLNFYVTSKTSNGGDTQAVHIVPASQASITELVVADFNNLTFSSKGNIAYASITASAYNQISIDVSALTIGAINKFALIFNRDLNNSAMSPNVGNIVAFRSGEHVTTPLYLEVEYVPGVGNPGFMSSGGLTML